MTGAALRPTAASALAAAWLAAPAIAQSGAQDGAAVPDYFVAIAAERRLAQHIVAICPGLDLDVDALIEQTVTVFERLEADGLGIDDPRLRNEATISAIRARTRSELGRIAPRATNDQQFCAAANVQILRETDLGRLLAPRDLPQGSR